MVYSYAVMFGVVGVLLVMLAVFAISVPTTNNVKMKLFRIFSDKGTQLVLTAIILGFNLNTNYTILALITLHVVHTVYILKYQKHL